MPQNYLKCKYYENAPMIVFPHEYLVTFKCGEFKNPKAVINEETNETFPKMDEEWCILNREEVIPLGVIADW
jgi:hypothetical protein